MVPKLRKAGKFPYSRNTVNVIPKEERPGSYIDEIERQSLTLL
jgi:hypothetical protein